MSKQPTPVFEEYEPENDAQKLVKKARDSPLVPLGKENSFLSN